MKEYVVWFASEMRTPDSAWSMVIAAESEERAKATFLKIMAGWVKVRENEE